MSEHESVRGLLALAAAGVLDPDEQVRVDRHVRDCEECRREFETWQAYARELHHLPQPQAPARLMERTRDRVLQERGGITEHRWEDLILASIALFAWTVTLSGWLVLRIFTGGALLIMGTNFLRLATWSLVSTGLMWISAAAAALVLGRKRRQWRRI
jgi:anti-sigma factor RsiW